MHGRLVPSEYGDGCANRWAPEITVTRSVSDIIAELGAFTAMDDENADVQRLDEITDGLASIDDASVALPALFGVLERHADCELGVPGPIVHTIEAIGDHTDELLASITRVPTTLSVWMVNRLLNFDLPHDLRKSLISTLTRVSIDDSVADNIRDSANESLEFQRRS